MLEGHHYTIVNSRLVVIISITFRHGRSLVFRVGANPPVSFSPSPPLALKVGPSLPLDVGPLKSSHDPQYTNVIQTAGSGAQPQPKSNLVHFSFKI